MPKSGPICFQYDEKLEKLIKKNSIHICKLLTSRNFQFFTVKENLDYIRLHNVFYYNIVFGIIMEFLISYNSEVCSFIQLAIMNVYLYGLFEEVHLKNHPFLSTFYKQLSEQFPVNLQKFVYMINDATHIRKIYDIRIMDLEKELTNMNGVDNLNPQITEFLKLKNVELSAMPMIFLTNKDIINKNWRLFINTLNEKYCCTSSIPMKSGDVFNRIFGHILCSIENSDKLFDVKELNLFGDANNEICYNMNSKNRLMETDSQLKPDNLQLTQFEECAKCLNRSDKQFIVNQLKENYMQNSAIFEEYLHILFHKIPVTKKYLELLSLLFNETVLDSSIVSIFISKIISHTSKIEDAFFKERHVELVCCVLNILLKNDNLPELSVSEVESFSIENSSLICAISLYQTVKVRHLSSYPFN